MTNLIQSLGKVNSGPSSRSVSDMSSVSRGVGWTTEDFIEAHVLVRESGMYNFEGCRLPVPTSIRYDRLELALGKEASPRDTRMLSLLKYGMPIDCKAQLWSQQGSEESLLSSQLSQ